MRRLAKYLIAVTVGVVTHPSVADDHTIGGPRPPIPNCHLEPGACMRLCESYNRCVTDHCADDVESCRMCSSRRTARNECRERVRRGVGGGGGGGPLPG